MGGETSREAEIKLNNYERDVELGGGGGGEQINHRTEKFHEAENSLIFIFYKNYEKSELHQIKRAKRAQLLVKCNRSNKKIKRIYNFILDSGIFLEC